MKRLVVPILAVLLLLGGCSPNGATVEERQLEIAELERENLRLQRQITQLEQQLAEKEARQDKSKAIAEFALEALELQRGFMDARSQWLLEWFTQNPPENYPRYVSRSKELETIDEAGKLLYGVNSLIATIEQLYAPPEAMEVKRKLLAEGDSLQQAFVDIMNFYASPDYQPSSLYDEAHKFISDDLGDIDRGIRRELTDLSLEYGQ